MKVVVGKFKSEPFHSLSKKDVSLIVKLVPSNWIAGINTIILGAKIYAKTQVSRPVIFSPASGRLTILSRGYERREIASEVLCELAVAGGEAAKDESKHKLKSERVRFDGIIKPYLEQFLKAKI